MSICSRPLVLLLSTLSAASLCGGCASSPRFAARTATPPATNSTKDEAPPPEAATPARSSSGKVLLTLEGVASYYADEFHGKVTSNGEVFDMNDFTAAHRTFPFGTNVRVTNLENHKTVVVRINDRGPFKDGRIIDLSLAAAKALDLITGGTARVKLEVLEWGTGK